MGDGSQYDEAISRWASDDDARRASALLLLVTRGSLDPRPAPNWQLGDKLEKLQGPTSTNLHAACCQGEAGMSGQGALVGPAAS